MRGDARAFGLREVGEAGVGPFWGLPSAASAFSVRGALAEYVCVCARARVRYKWARACLRKSRKDIMQSGHATKRTASAAAPTSTFKSASSGCVGIPC